jgi:L-methionine (R)-S-oxide reductase
MSSQRKKERYGRIYDQLSGLLAKTPDPTARMATVAALLFHKMDRFDWCGFYRLVGSELIVGPYQGPLACQVLEKGKGVCWAALQRKETIVVPDVTKFPGHIACDPHSRSEIVVPLKTAADEVWAVLDVDSQTLDSFDDTDADALQRIVSLI